MKLILRTLPYCLISESEDLNILTFKTVDILQSIFLLNKCIKTKKIPQYRMCIVSLFKSLIKVA